MNNNEVYGITLVELLVAISLVGLLVVGIASLDNYARFYLLSSDRRAQIQNEAAYILEHLAKTIIGTANSGGAIGDSNQLPIDRTDIAGDTAIRIWIDWNRDGRLDATGASDKQIAYRYRGATSNYEIRYYSNYTDSPNSYEIISRDKIISDFSTDYLSYDNTEGDGDPIDNYIEITVVACWDPAGDCGSMDNPQVRMKTRIKMPAVST